MGLLTNTRKLLITAINDGWHFLLHINCGEMLLFGARLSQHWFGAASFKPHYRDDRCVSVCVCLLSIRSLKRKSSGNQTIQRQSKKSLPPNPSLYECVWVQGPGCLPYLSLPNPFLCTVPLGWAGIFVTSVVSGPAPVSSLTCLLTSPGCISRRT